MVANLSTIQTEFARCGVPGTQRLRPYLGSQPLAARDVWLVEYRDEVFARLAADLTEAGLQVERALCAACTSRMYARFRPDLLVVNADLPDGSGWLLTAKLRMTFPKPHILLYAPWPLPDAVAMAEFVGADRLIAYEGDLYRLSAAIVSHVFVPMARCVAA